MDKMRGAPSSKPATTLDELRNQIGEGWLVHQETAFLQAAKEELEAETLRLREEFEALKEPIDRYHRLMGSWQDFVGWAANV